MPLQAPTLDLAMETVSGENVPSIAQAEPWGVNVQTEMADCPVYEADRILSCQNRLGESERSIFRCMSKFIPTSSTSRRHLGFTETVAALDRYRSCGDSFVR